VTDRTPGQPPVVAVVGPTATGKTETGILLAEALGGEIISADSQAVYRGMDVGTAKPDVTERARIPFHLIDVADPDESFSVARFKELAVAALDSIRERRKRPLVVGGTGLYVKVLLEDYGLTATAADPVLRAKLDADAAQYGVPALHKRLEAVDPEAVARIHPNDRIRIVRALEVFERTGEPISVQQQRDRSGRQRLPAVKFGLTANRDTLSERINQRVDAMVTKGLVGEVEELLRSGYSEAHPPLRSLGYKEICAHLRGEMELNQAIEDIKSNTRRFAKRQMTWFRADPEIRWIDITGRAPADVADEILTRLKSPAQGVMRAE
jgi:tRNA dimethylallyltransferase